MKTIHEQYKTVKWLRTKLKNYKFREGQDNRGLESGHQTGSQRSIKAFQEVTEIREKDHCLSLDFAIYLNVLHNEIFGENVCKSEKEDYLKRTT